MGVIDLFNFFFLFPVIYFMKGEKNKDQMVTSKEVLLLQIGTVLCAKDAKDAIEFGAKFLMSPVLVKDILVGLSGDEALYIPGAMTPTEQWVSIFFVQGHLN
nr:KHG/KDPG aldolase-like isoform X2 [Ipomoea batatas]